MTSYERMSRMLRSTGLYRLDGSSAVDIELQRYAYYLDFFESQIKQLAENAFVETVDNTTFESWKQLFSLPSYLGRPNLEEIVKLRLAINNRDFTKEGVKKCMASGGFEVELTEDFENGTVTVEILSDQNLFGTKAEKEAFLQECLPCHAKGIFVWP